MIDGKVDHAIVIGIDDYANSDWRLAAAVRGAKEFAAWVIEPGAGRATTETLTLLLSPRDAPPRPDGLDAAEPPAEEQLQRCARPATRDNIYGAFERYMYDDIPPTMRRLWVFYAGHAVAPARGSVDSPPVMVPAEEGGRQIERYLGDKPLPLGTYLDALRTRTTGPQFFFIDACRVPTPAEATFDIGSMLTVNLRKLAGVADQAALFATTAGKLAHERGLDGLFTRALLDGLRGHGGSSPDGARGDFIVTIDALASFVKERVNEWSRVPGAPDAPLPTQIADRVSRGDLTKVALVRFKADERPHARLELFVKPSNARKLGEAAIKVLQYSGAYSREEKREPLHWPVAWRLPHGEHLIEVIAPEHQPWRQSVQLRGDLQLPVRLVPLAYGYLHVETPDALARIDVYSTEDVLLGRGRARVHERLAVGRYRVEVRLPGHCAVAYPVDVTAEHPVWIRPAPLTAAAPIAALLAQLDMQPEHGLARPSAAFAIGTSSPSQGASGLGSDPREPVKIETTTATHVGSLLAWAVAAARFPSDAETARLRRLGAAQGREGDVQVMVGDVRRDPIPIEVAYGVVGRERAIALEDVAGAGGLARQWCAAGYAAGSLRLCASTWRTPIRLPMPGVRGHVSVVIVAHEVEHGPELHRYCLPAWPPRDDDQFTDAIRLMEDEWRSLQAGVPLLPLEAEELLARDDLDPLTRAVVGFRLHREDRLESIGTLADPVSPLSRMLSDAPGLPDVHVLAALVAARKGALTLEGATGASLRSAASAGTPVIARAYQVLAPWLPALRGAVIAPPALAHGHVWTVFESGDQNEVIVRTTKQVQS